MSAVNARNPRAAADSFNIVVTGRYGPEHEFAPLQEAGHRLSFGPSIMDRTVPLPEADMIALVREADVLIPASRDLVTERVLAASDRLRAVVAPYIGVDRIDVAAATHRGILVVNSPCGENFVGVAEATIGVALMLLKRVRPIETKLRAGAWRGRLWRPAGGQDGRHRRRRPRRYRGRATPCRLARPADRPRPLRVRRPLP